MQVCCGCDYNALGSGKVDTDAQNRMVVQSGPHDMPAAAECMHQEFRGVMYAVVRCIFHCKVIQLDQQRVYQTADLYPMCGM